MSKVLNFLFNTNSLKNQRLPWVDYAKGIAIILVAYRHVLIGINRSGLEVHAYLMNANEIFYSFRMPLFFILSGVFIGKSLARRSLKDFIITKWKILLYPYLLWCVIQITLQIIFSQYTNAQRSAISYLYILTAPDAIDQMWYLSALFNVTIIYALSRTLLHLKPAHQLLIGLTCYYLSTVFTSGPQHDILFYYLFYALGDLIASDMLNKNNYPRFASPLFFWILCPLFITSQWYFINHLDIQYNSIFVFAVVALIGCAFMLNICFILQKTQKVKSLRVVGYHSLYIYVIHVIITGALRTLFMRGLGITNVPLLLFILLSLGIPLSIIIYNVVMRMGGWFFFTLYKKEDEFPKSQWLWNLPPLKSSLIKKKSVLQVNANINNK